MLNTVHHFQLNCLQAKAEAADLNAALILLKPGAIRSLLMAQQCFESNPIRNFQQAEA